MLHLNASVNYTFNGVGVPVASSLMATFSALIETPPPSQEGMPQLTSPSGYNWSITPSPPPTPLHSACQQTESQFAWCVV